MTDKRIAILGTGDMGAAIGRTLVAHGVDVATTHAGRSAHSQRLAAEAGLRLEDSLDAALAGADIFLSVVPSKAAAELAREVAGALGRSRRSLLYADCNAVSPDTSRAVGDIVTAAGAAYCDGGIIGPPPGVGTPCLYVSGAHGEALAAFDGMGLTVRHLGPEIGRASALKMVFAGINKGINALCAATLAVAEGLGVGDELEREITDRLTAVRQRVDAQVPYLPLNAGRWIDEMHEIAATFEAAGQAPGFHQGAAALYDVLARTPFAAETRETFDAERTPRDVARACVALGGGSAR